MWPNPQQAADLVTLTEEILNRKLHFLSSGCTKDIQNHDLYTAKYMKRIFSPETIFYWKKNKNLLVSNIISQTNFVELIDILSTLKFRTTLSTLKLWTALKALSGFRYWKSEHSSHHVNYYISKQFLMVKCSWHSSKVRFGFYTVQDLNFLRAFFTINFML